MTETTLNSLRAGADLAEVLTYFDSLPPVTVERMIGAWRGSGLDTGNPFDGLLEGMGWRGKTFRSADKVDPLVFDGRRRPFRLNPGLLPIGAAIRLGPVLRKQPAAQRLTRTVLPLLSTGKPQARLRMIQYRGVVTATMCYDALPINDHFRLIDDDTVLGAMDLRGLDQPFMFVLTRDGGTA